MRAYLVLKHSLTPSSNYLHRPVRHCKTQADSVEAYNDPGICYIRENGLLRSPPGLGSSEHRHLPPDSGLPVISPFTVGESYAVGLGVVCFNPCSLFSQALNFVARNLWRVESLVAFPDIVGKQLFDAAKEQGIFTSKNLRQASLKLFTEAYSVEVLSQLNVEGNHLVLEEYLPEMLLFSNLSVLELGGCALGEEHPFWSHIGSFPCLCRLGLGRTGLSDHIMQKLTAPLRLLKRGPRDLQVLDLSGNSRLTERAIRYLKVFCNLQALDVTACCFSPHGIKQLHLEMRLRQLAGSEVGHPDVDVFCGVTRSVGWAVGVVEDWMADTRARLTDKRAARAQHGCPRARKFYSIKSGQLGFLDVSSKSPPATKSSALQPTVRLVRETSGKNVEKSCGGVFATFSPPDKGASSSGQERKQAPANNWETATDWLESDTDNLVMRRAVDELGSDGKERAVGSRSSCRMLSRVAKGCQEESNRAVKTCRGPTGEWISGSEVPNSAAAKVMRKKRKRPWTTEGAGSRQSGSRPRPESEFGQEEEDLMSSYLRVRAQDQDPTDKSTRPRILRAMDSSMW